MADQADSVSAAVEDEAEILLKTDESDLEFHEEAQRVENEEEVEQLLAHNSEEDEIDDQQQQQQQQNDDDDGNKEQHSGQQQQHYQHPPHYRGRGGVPYRGRGRGLLPYPPGPGGSRGYGGMRPPRPPFMPHHHPHPRFRGFPPRPPLLGVRPPPRPPPPGMGMRSRPPHPRMFMPRMPMRGMRGGRISSSNVTTIVTTTPNEEVEVNSSNNEAEEESSSSGPKPLMSIETPDQVRVHVDQKIERERIQEMQKKQIQQQNIEQYRASMHQQQHQPQPPPPPQPHQPRHVRPQHHHHHPRGGAHHHHNHSMRGGITQTAMRHPPPPSIRHQHSYPGTSAPTATPSTSMRPSLKRHLSGSSASSSYAPSTKYPHLAYHHQQPQQQQQHHEQLQQQPPQSTVVRSNLRQITCVDQQQQQQQQQLHHSNPNLRSLTPAANSTHNGNLRTIPLTGPDMSSKSASGAASSSGGNAGCRVLISNLPTTATFHKVTMLTIQSGVGEKVKVLKMHEGNRAVVEFMDKQSAASFFNANNRKTMEMSVMNMKVV